MPSPAAEGAVMYMCKLLAGIKHANDKRTAVWNICSSLDRFWNKRLAWIDNKKLMS